MLIVVSIPTSKKKSGKQAASRKDISDILAKKTTELDLDLKSNTLLN
jgi:hypothetical protein